MMRDICSLEHALAANLTWHKARARFIAALVNALVTVKTVSPVVLPCALAGQAGQDSQSKKLHRILEVPHPTEPDPLDRSFALLALNCCPCRKLGGWLHQQNAIKLKKHMLKPKSMLRHGFYYLDRLIGNITNFELVARHKAI
jgi:hypothetical protein